VFKAGDLVRHKVKTEWGLGRVVGQTTEGKVLVKFAGKQGDVLLTAAFAETHLIRDAGGDWQEARRPHRPESVVRRVPCGNCAADLREPLTSADGQWQSCPECSARHGRQHVFLPFPEAFDGHGAPAAVEDDPKRHWCHACRSGNTTGRTRTRTCRDVPRQPAARPSQP
jgi:hypothetical protein